MERIAVPELYCPFHPEINEHAEAVQAQTLRWASGYGLLPHERSRRMFRAAAFGRLAARFHPLAHREQLQLISDLYAWMFLQDDYRDDSRVGRYPGRLSDHDRRLLTVLSGEEPADPDWPLSLALGDLGERLNQLAPGPVWIRRLVRAVEEYFLSTLWEARNRARREVPDLETYLRMRPLTSGLAVDDELIELAGQAQLFRGAREHPSVRRLTAISRNVVCWANDLFSLHKELACKDTHNLVLVLVRSRGLGLEEAAIEVARMHDAEVETFVSLCSSPPSFGEAVDSQLGRYVNTLQHRMRGNLDWSRESGRYRSGTRDGTLVVL